MATTRVSTAAVVHVVQPRFEPPATTNRATFDATALGATRQTR